MNPSPQIITLEIIDYFIQAVLLVVAFVYPWRARRSQGWRVFCYPILISFLWGIWRVIIFDPATSNDVPGIGYWAVGFMLGVIGLLLYCIRCFFTRQAPTQMKSYCDECGKDAQGFGHTGGRMLCGACYKRFYPEECRKLDQKNEILRKRVAQMKWLRLIDLPGYKEWSDQFQGLDQIICDLEEYHIRVHLDEFNQSPEVFFEQHFQGWIDDWAERGGIHQSLNEFRKPGS